MSLNYISALKMGSRGYNILLKSKRIKIGKMPPFSTILYVNLMVFFILEYNFAVGRKRCRRIGPRFTGTISWPIIKKQSYFLGDDLFQS